ncbi:MAG: SCO family protein [Candidatus Binatia bacterium]
MTMRIRLAALLLTAACATSFPVGPAGAETAADSSAPLKAGIFSPARLAPDFKLRGSDGTELTLARYRGKVVVVVFGFTSCPQVCPTTLSTLAKARKQLGSDAENFQVVYITVDPERDTVERMREYLAHFDATFVGATGTDEQLAAVRKEYGIFANRENSGESYVFNHSSYTYLVERNGYLRALMPYGMAPDAYVHDVRILLSTPADRAAPAGEARP